jgi:hypothetical protein
VLGLFPHLIFEARSESSSAAAGARGPNFRLVEPVAADSAEVEMFGVRFRIASRDGGPLPPQDRRMIRAIGAVLGLRYALAFEVSNPSRLELFRGGSEDHYVAAYVEPALYELPASRPSRIASTIQTLRTAALSTYENHRVSTGALLFGPEAADRPETAADALPYGVELTGLKSIHRLCDGQRTLFLVDCDGKLAGIVDVSRFATMAAGEDRAIVPGPRVYEPHARATRRDGHVCLVLSPNQEIKLFAGGAQTFAFAHGRWRILDPATKFALWQQAVTRPELARALFEAALNLAEARQGALFVVARDPEQAAEHLIPRHDLLSEAAPAGPPAELAPRDPLAKRALHYLARGRDAVSLDPPILEALASLDGALVVDPAGRLLAFGAILPHGGSSGLAPAEGARTTAALVASRYGPVLKVSEDGIVSCFLDGARAWEL